MVEFTAVPGRLLLVLLLEESRFYSWAPTGDLDRLMNCFEDRTKLAEKRSDQIAHMNLRVEIAKRLRQTGCEAAWTEVLAAGCLWLSLRHYLNGDLIVRGITELARSGAILTVSIADSQGCYPDTAWAFMVGTEVLDGRDTLSRHRSGRVIVERPTDHSFAN